MEDFEPAEFGPNVEVGGEGGPFKVRFVGEKGNFRVSQRFFRVVPSPYFLLPLCFGCYMVCYNILRIL